MHFSTYTGSSANFNEKNCMQQYTYCIVLFTRNACKRYICRHIKQISFCLGLRMGEEMNWNGHGKIFTVMEIPKTGMWCWLYNSKQWKSFCTHLQWVNLGICLYFVYIFLFSVYYDICINIFSSVTQSCPTLCDSMDCGMPGFPFLHQLWSLLKLMSVESVMKILLAEERLPLSGLVNC